MKVSRGRRSWRRGGGKIILVVVGEVAVVVIQEEKGEESRRRDRNLFCCTFLAVSACSVTCSCRCCSLDGRRR